jgi:hypothetical protein
VFEVCDLKHLTPTTAANALVTSVLNTIDLVTNNVCPINQQFKQTMKNTTTNMSTYLISWEKFDFNLC